MPSLAPSRSNDTRVTAVLAAKRAAVNAAFAEDGGKSQDAVMGGLNNPDFQDAIKEATKELKTNLKSKSDQIPISKLNALLKLVATGAMKEVEAKTKMLKESIETTATANAAVVTDLKSIDTWNEAERLRLEDMLLKNKLAPGNFSMSESESVHGGGQQYEDFQKILENLQFMKIQPEDMLDKQSDEYKQEVLLMTDAPSDAEESMSKLVDMRITINKNRLATTRLKLAKMINDSCSTNKMLKDKYSPFPLARYHECHTQTAWISMVNQWIQKPAVIDKYLEIAHDIVFYTSAYDNAKGIYGKTGLGMKISLEWNDARIARDKIGYMRAKKAELLYEEIGSLATAYQIAAAASKKGIKTGLTANSHGGVRCM